MEFYGVIPGRLGWPPYNEAILAKLPGDVGMIKSGSRSRTNLPSVCTNEMLVIFGGDLIACIWPLRPLLFGEENPISRPILGTFVLIRKVLL